MTVSVIIPTLNEAQSLTRALSSARGAEELIVVDGGSRDRTVLLARRQARVLHTPGGRGPQLNAGAAVARGRWLLFLHADAVLHAGAIEAIRQQRRAVGGCFTLGCLEAAAPALVRLVNCAGNWRARVTGVMYGDQGLFVRRDVFERLGGFAPIPLMEDLEFSMRLRRVGRMAVIGLPIRVSSRRWQQRGALAGLLGNWRRQWAFFRGADPRQLHREYYAAAASAAGGQGRARAIAAAGGPPSLGGPSEHG